MKKIRLSGSDAAFAAVVYGLAAVSILIVIYPLYFIVVASLSEPSAVTNGKVWLLPSGFTLDGYKALIEYQSIWIGYRNTIFYTLAGTAWALIVNIPASYALSRKDLPLRVPLTFYYLFVMFFSGGLIPTYLLVKELGLFDSWLVLIVPFSVSIYNIIVARTYFSTSIPSDMLDAAQIDGCGNLKFFFSIILPLSKPIIAVLALWTAVGIWNSYFNALIYLQDKGKMPLQIILRNILITNQMTSSMGTGEAAQVALRQANLIRYAAIIVSTLPIMCFYPFVQKHFNQGVMIGAVKG
ncbi:MAG: carbohydrate ABC transporter permease [Clostridiales bacterium]|jgi:putative aldouronate transport system permease protein|nr:carbohydrate ABC transporter permease [Clostridiales bacterium]MDR2750708.1 carbohydrate ABC transporter permease [Clostridiales bacterium]